MGTTMKYRLYSALLLSAVSLAESACWAQEATADDAAVKEYNLPAQPLADTLRAIARTSGTNILADGRSVEGKQAPALVGRYSVARALGQVLKGSGLVVRTTPSGLVVEPDTASAGIDEETGTVTDGTIVVTGTRIRGTPIPSPVINFSENSIRNAGQASLGEVVRSIPQSFGGGQQPGIGFNVPGANGVDVGGGSSINLRGLGSDATLTLLNGHRVSYSSSRQSVDVSAIPLSIVDRLEIVADGASAIYGSDAVAGVANIILKRDYRGFETRARLGSSTDGGNFTQHYGALGGSTWASGGFALAYEYSSNTAIDAKDRSYARNRTPGLTLFPSLNSHNVLLTGHQALGRSLSFSIDALYGRRHEFSAFPLDFNLDLAIARGETAARSRTFAIAPALAWDIGADWSIELAGTIAEDRTKFRNDQFTGTMLDFRSAGCYCNKGQSVEFSGSGRLTTLPSGDIKGAFGAGYRNNEFALFAGAGNTQNISRAQDSRYLYAEISLPVVSPSQAVGGIERLNLTGAVRYENYPGIGDVVTPKFGLIYSPTALFDLKASWGQSFRAPTLRQQYQPKGVILFRPAVLGGSGFPAGTAVALVQGGNSALKPERANSWSATLALHPPSWRGARIELSYFDTRYRDRIVTPIGIQSQALANAIYSDYVTLNPSAAQVMALVDSAGTFINASGAPYVPANVIAIADTSNVNAGRQRIQGVDALLNYQTDLGGVDSTIDFTANATYLSSNQKISAAQPTTKLAGTIFNPPHFRARGGASWRDREFTLTANLNYAGSVSDNRTTNAVSVSSLTSLDLTTRYQTTGTGLFAGLDVTLSVQNLLNAKPDTITGIFLEAPYDTTNYSPVGRYVAISIAKKW
jgi:iron complex outermembrane recepter protein